MKHMFIALVVLGVGVDARAQSSGYPACDKFIGMVTECINTKMPPSERANRQKELDAFRGALGFIPADKAAGACEENIRLEMQRDKYGCYAERAAAAGVKTACSLITPAELQSVLGAAFGPGTPGNSKCRFNSTVAPPRLVEIEVNWSDGRDAMKAWRGGVATVRRQTGKAAVPAASVAGVADDAYHVGMGLMPMLAVRKGDVAVSVMAPATREQLIAIARKALERIQ